MAPPHRNAHRPAVAGRRAVVTSAHPLASMAGIQVLVAGGNAADAAVAVASTLNVVEPYMSGIGGVGAMVISSAARGERHVLNFVSRVPLAADPDRATKTDLEDGPRACLTPGNLGGWLAAHERFGTMPRSAVFAPAIRMAGEGVPLTWKNVEFVDNARSKLAVSAEAQRIYLGDGDLRPGRVLVNKDLATTYRQVAEGGADVFYRGPLAQTICRAVRDAGGWLAEEDLAGCAPEWLTPMAMPYRDTELITVPPPFVSFQAFQTLRILEADDLAGWGHNSAEYLHHFIEAVKLATADRLAYAYAAEVPLDGLTSKAYAGSQRARINRRRAGVSEGERFNPERLPDQITAGHPEEFAAVFAREQTTHFACADADGPWSRARRRWARRSARASRSRGPGSSSTTSYSGRIWTSTAPTGCARAGVWARIWRRCRSLPAASSECRSGRRDPTAFCRRPCRWCTMCWRSR